MIFFYFIFKKDSKNDFFFLNNINLKCKIIIIRILAFFIQSNIKPLLLMLKRIQQ